MLHSVLNKLLCAEIILLYFLFRLRHIFNVLLHLDWSKCESENTVTGVCVYSDTFNLQISENSSIN